MADESSSSQLLNPGNLGRFVPSPDMHRRPHSNIIQPAPDSRKPMAALPGTGNAGKEKEGRVDGNDDRGKTVASDEDEDAGYSSGTDDDEDVN